YIVPGMEIYLPDTTTKKEVQQPVKEQPKSVKEQPVPTPAPAPKPAPAPAPKKEQIVKPAPAPAPVPAPMPMPQPQKPIWQGDIIYFQQPQPMPMPNWQTNVHVQPTFENTVTVQPPQQAPM